MATADAGAIVVGVDGSQSSLAALDWAAGQAALTGSPLDVVMTWEWPSSFGWALPLPDYDPAGDAGRVLDEAVQKVRAARPGLQIRTSVVEGHPAPALIQASRNASLLVVGSRGHGEFAGMLLGSVSEHAVTNARCPVVVVRNPG
jgi:nucleotide-binding universal stress UspA family protein